MSEHLAISEVFGPTVQGEGPNLGRLAGFVRVGRCNLACSWCDAAYTWDWKGVTGTAYEPAEQVRTRTVDEVAQAVIQMRVGLAVLTGGEPLLQQRALTDLARQLYERALDVEVETNGTRMPSRELCDIARFNVSPKLAHSNAGDLEHRIVPTVLRTFAETPGVAFKFVVRDLGDMAEVKALVGRLGLDPRTVWIMPEGVDPAGIVASTMELADAVIGHGWNLTTRLHVLAWGNERGR